VFLDAGGVIVLPHRGLVQAALAEARIQVDAASVSRAHYRAVRDLDRIHATRANADLYPQAFCRALGVGEERVEDAVRALSWVGDRDASGQILWSEPAPGARQAIDALTRAGIAVLVVTNSDGRATENLRDCGICQIGSGAGASVVDVIDSARVGASKPDPRIFRIALERANVEARSVVHVGDMVSVDVAGARATGLVPIHLDPDRRCRLGDHRHVRSLTGIWRHIAAGDHEPAGAARK
jgi:FMN phosphatase YigB (HAD superfamily)